MSQNPSDYGPSLIKARDGSWKPWGGASEVELSDAPDIDAPSRTVRRACRVDPLARILGRGEPNARLWPDIERRRYASAERLRDDAALASGASAGQDGSGVRSGWTGYGFGHAQIEAIKRVREARAILSTVDIVDCMVLGMMGITAYAKAIKRRDRIVRPLLVAALDQLSDHYDGLENKC